MPAFRRRPPRAPSAPSAPSAPTFATPRPRLRSNVAYPNVPLPAVTPPPPAWPAGAAQQFTPPAAATQQQPAQATSQPQAGDPRDSTYWATVAKLNFQKTQGLSNVDQQHAYDQTDLNEALRRMTVQHPKDLGGARSNANQQGLLYSSTLGNQLGDIETNFSRQTGDANQAFNRREAARQAARSAIEQGYTLDEAAALAAGADRQAAAAESAALAGALTAPSQDSPDVAAPAAPAAAAQGPPTFGPPTPQRVTNGRRRRRR